MTKISFHKLSSAAISFFVFIFKCYLEISSSNWWTWSHTYPTSPQTGAERRPVLGSSEEVTLAHAGQFLFYSGKVFNENSLGGERAISRRTKYLRYRIEASLMEPACTIWAPLFEQPHCRLTCAWPEIPLKLGLVLRNLKEKLAIKADQWGTAVDD